MQSQIAKTLFFISLLKVCHCNLLKCPNGTIFYFAYGSNLLAKRMHISNPTAVFYGIAKLQNYRLDFNVFDDVWQGAVATIVEDDKEEVWGSVWILSANQVDNLDKQEDVATSWYYAKNVTLTTPSGDTLVARTYEETINPTNKTDSSDVPKERRPSSTYLEVIALGAIESHLPADYIAFIFSFPTNGKMATKGKRDQLGYPF